jgi:hypothetical protein
MVHLQQVPVLCLASPRYHGPYRPLYLRPLRYQGWLASAAEVARILELMIHLCRHFVQTAMRVIGDLPSISWFAWKKTASYLIAAIPYTDWPSRGQHLSQDAWTRCSVGSSTTSSGIMSRDVLKAKYEEEIFSGWSSSRDDKPLAVLCAPWKPEHDRTPYKISSLWTLLSPSKKGGKVLRKFLVRRYNVIYIRHIVLHKLQSLRRRQRGASSQSTFQIKKWPAKEGPIASLRSLSPGIRR